MEYARIYLYLTLRVVNQILTNLLSKSIILLIPALIITTQTSCKKPDGKLSGTKGTTPVTDEDEVDDKKVNVVADTVAPVIGSYITPSSAIYNNQSSYMFSWTSATDDVALANPAYTINKFNNSNCSGSPVGTVTQNESSFTYSSLSTGNIYSVSIYATDSSGNVSLALCSSSVTVDLTPPSAVSISNPSSNTVTNQSNYNFTWVTPSDTGGSGLATTNTFTIDKYANATCSGSAASTIQQATTSLNYTGMTNGNYYSIKIIAFDNAGNPSSSICSNSVQMNTSISGPVSFTLPAANLFQSATAYNFTWTAPSDPGPGLRAVNKYNVEWFSNSTCSGAPVSSAYQNGTSYNYTSLANNTSYSLRVTPYDVNEAAGTAQCSYYAGVDTAAPSAITLTAPSASSYITADNYDFTWSAPSETGGSGLRSTNTYQIEKFSNGICSGGPTATVSQTGTTYNFASLVNGTTYSVRLTAYDNANNASSTTCSSLVMRDTTAPTAITYINPSATIIQNSLSYSFSWNAATDGGSGLKSTNTYQIEKFSNGTCSGSADVTVDQTGTTYNYTGMSGGSSYSIKITAYDKANNASTTVCSSDIQIDVTAPSAPSGISRVSPSSQYGTDSTPELQVTGVTSGDTIEIYADNTCSVPSLKGSGVASGTTINITINALTENNYTFYALAKDPVGNQSSCSVVVVAYTYDVTAPSNPSGWTLASPSNAVTSNDNTPQISGSSLSAENGGSAKIYDDSSCTQLKGDQIIAAGIFTVSNITYLTNGTDDGAKAFYGQIIDTAGNSSTCTNLSLGYTLVSSPAVLTITDVTTNDFGAVNYLATSSLTFTVTNSGVQTASSMVFTFVTGTNHSFTGGTCGVTLAGAGTCTKIVQFTSPGEAAGDAAITDQLNLAYYDSLANQNTNRALTANGNPASVTVTAVYPTNGSKWLDYVLNNNGGTDTYDQPDTACNAPTALYSACIHGGEKRKATLTGLTSCSGLTIQDITLGAFDWTCKVVTGVATIYSVGLKSAKGLGDLVNSTSWKNNQVKVSNGSSVLFTSSSATWWTNTIQDLPDNSATAAEILSTSSTIYTLAASRTTSGYNLNADKIAVVILPSQTLSWNGTATNNTDSSTLEAGTSYRSMISAGNLGSNKYLWIEGDFDCEGGTVDSSYGFQYAGSATAFSVFRNVIVRRCTSSGISSGSSHSNFLSNVTSHSNGIRGFSLGESYSTFRNLVSYSNGDHGMYFTGTDLNGDVLTAYSNGNGTSDKGIWISGSNSTFSNLLAYSNPYRSIQIDGSGHTFTNITAYGSTNSSYGDGLCVGATYTKFVNVSVYNNKVHGLHVLGGDYNQFYNVSSKQNGSIGIRVAGSAFENRFNKINASGNGTSGIEDNDGRNTWSHIVASDNTAYGIRIYGLNSTFAFVTATNNLLEGIYSTATGKFTINQLLSTNNASGMSFDLISSTVTLSQIATANNTNYGVSLTNNSAEAIFINNLLVNAGVSGNRCFVSASTGLINSSCSDAGTDGSTTYTGQTSTARFQTSTINFTNSFLGKVTANDTLNTSDSNGSQTFGSITNWINFDNFFRVWGKEGSAFPNSDHQGKCTTGTCRIWDWRLNVTDTVVRNNSGDGVTSNQAFVSGSTCPNPVHGNISMIDYQITTYFTGINAIEAPGDGFGDNDGICESGDKCYNQFLINALEISDDLIGDNDGLCETNESCIYQPNFGSYLGEGDYVANGTCTFQNGTVSGVTMYAYPTNGI